MQTLQGEKINLRALEPTDLEFLYQLENDESIWQMSNTTQPFSKYVLKEYLANSHRDIYEVKQLRLVICTTKNKKTIGFLDLFDFEPKHRRAGIGILIFNVEERGKGYAAEALRLIANYAKGHLNMHQLYANIMADNDRSIQLFKKAGYVKSGVKRDWIVSAKGFQDELLYQLLLNGEG